MGVYTHRFFIRTLLALASVFLFIPIHVEGQVTTNGGSGLAITYPTLAASITALNAAAITSPVIITLQNNETAPVGGYSITAQGTTVNTIIIDGNGFTVTAGLQVAGVRNDAVFKIVGGDYITLQNFVIIENPGNTVTTPVANNTMTEWGVALLYATATNGAKNNTILNNNISLNRAFTNAVGVYSSVRHLPTGSPLTLNDITNVSGSNSNNRIYGNNISNINCPIIFVGSATAAYMDSGNDIGGNLPITGNTITNWGNNGGNTVALNVTATIFGIFLNSQVGYRIGYNTITSAALTSVSTTRAILVDYINTPTGTFTNEITYNTITLTNTTASAYEIIRTQALGTLPNVTENITYNNLLNCISGGEFNGIIHNTSSPGTLNISDNMISGCFTYGTTQNNYGIRNFPTATVVNTLNINNNQLGNAAGGFLTYNGSTSGALYGISNEGGAATCALLISSNNFQGINQVAGTTGANTYIFNSAATSSQNISSNTFTNLTAVTTGNVTFINNSVNLTATGSQTINSNSIVTGFSKTGIGGTVTLFNSAGTSPAGAVINQNNNNFSNITLTGATTMSGWVNTDGGTPNKTVNNNTFSNWNCGSGPVTVMNITKGNPLNISGNTIFNINGSGTVMGLNLGNSGNTQLGNISNNSITSLTSTGAATVVTGISSAVPATVANPVNITKNKIADLSSASGSAYGINITAGSHNIVNNRIGDYWLPGQVTAML